MIPRSDRRALTRELLREVNERVAELATRDDEILSFLCECVDDFCVEQVVMEVSRYGQIRDEGGYVLAPGHRHPAGRVVATRDEGARRQRPTVR